LWYNANLFLQKTASTCSSASASWNITRVTKLADHATANGIGAAPINPGMAAWRKLSGATVGCADPGPAPCSEKERSNLCTGNYSVPSFRIPLREPCGLLVCNPDMRCGNRRLWNDHRCRVALHRQVVSRKTIHPYSEIVQ
jgi:hypothetical protein